MSASPLTKQQRRVRPVLPWRHVRTGASDYWVITDPLRRRDVLVQEVKEKPGTYCVLLGNSRLTSSSTLAGDIDYSLEDAFLAVESYLAVYVDQEIRSLSKRYDEALTLRTTLRKGVDE